MGLLLQPRPRVDLRPRRPSGAGLFLQHGGARSALRSAARHLLFTRFEPCRSNGAYGFPRDDDRQRESGTGGERRYAGRMRSSPSAGPGMGGRRQLIAQVRRSHLDAVDRRPCHAGRLPDHEHRPSCPWRPLRRRAGRHQPRVDLRRRRVDRFAGRACQPRNPGSPEGTPAGPLPGPAHQRAPAGPAGRSPAGRPRHHADPPPPPDQRGSARVHPEAAAVASRPIRRSSPHHGAGWPELHWAPLGRHVDRVGCRISRPDLSAGWGVHGLTSVAAGY
ncbi:hypothetical protein ACWT_8097 [Actinoplanes sp. SE50]|nr:hypothetical protein ACPL_8228 [Actinoplanes sp. SE50/110]ATO87512.1 hypothetical protein ACWT_8097 [Actinoplanes sp. SE50]SLM04930.1 hypothetical protein ACSP50_8242 [Actinoplanes sp. SE50/110]